MRRRWTDYASKMSVQPILFDQDLLTKAQPRRRKNGSVKRIEPSESAILDIIYQGLKIHPLVKRVERTGVYTGRVVRQNGSIGYAKAGQKGMADICGKLKDGRKFAIEVKRRETRNSLTDEQREFLDDYIKRGDLAGVATSVEEAFAIVEGRA
jgi:hypothetical protein